MSNIIERIDGQGVMVLNNKGKQGSFARAIAFASRDVRIAAGQAMYAKWLANGQYRPIVNDVLSCGLVPKAAVPYVAGLVPSSGSISKDQLVALCTSVKNAVHQTGKALKGEKLFVFGVVERIAEEFAQGEVVDVNAVEVGLKRAA